MNIDEVQQDSVALQNWFLFSNLLIISLNDIDCNINNYVNTTDDTQRSVGVVHQPYSKWTSTG